MSSKFNKIDLERTELRYIFYSHDKNSLITEYQNLGFQPKIYTKTPTTITLYFGTKNGLEPGLSIKARIYTDTPLQNSWEITSDIHFDLLEIKTSLDSVDLGPEEIVADQEPEQSGLIVSIQDISKNDVVFWIQKASEDALIRESDLKQKNRLIGSEISQSSELSNISFKDIIVLLTKPSKLDQLLSPSLLEILQSKIRPKFKDNCLPIFITQYNRTHLLPHDDLDWNDLIRITIDPGVDYYDLHIPDLGTFQTEPTCIAERIHREPFGRIEFKMQKSFKKRKSLFRDVSSILAKYGCVAFLSKKWSGITSVSDRTVKKQGFWREPLSVEISGFFPVDKSWFHYGTILRYIQDLISQSGSFSPYFKQSPRLLVKNHIFVSGYIGVPLPSLIIQIEGASISYHLPTMTYPVKLSSDGSDFFITEEDPEPVKSTIVASKKELDRVLHPTIEIEGHTYFRSYGLLVKSTKTKRIYKLTIERKDEVKDRAKIRKIYCKMRYLGTENYLYKINKQAIYDDLKSFYEEFSGIMNKPVNDSVSLKY